ncbi:glycoside hydrolase family 28 protein [Ereboglobus luteus]|nr:glycoside hydrolase family 28 protein [Ereboglobus luteus]
MKYRLMLPLWGLIIANHTTLAAAAPGEPVIPEHTVSIMSFDARADGATDNAGAVQKAIDTVAKTGGRVVVPKGVFLCGPIRLASHVELRLEKGATLRMLPLDANFPSENGRCLSFISAKNCTDIKISGAGFIDGQGAAWWPLARAKKLALRRPQLVTFERCERVLLENITTIDPPNTHYALRLCKDVTMRGLTLRAPGNSTNTDGINISGKNYLITNCDISTGDDNIVILTHSAKDWAKPMCENFEIRDCKFGEGHGVSIGSHTSGGIRNVLVENCSFERTTAAIRMKAHRDKGGLVEDLTYRNLTVTGARYPLFISSYYPKEPKDPSLDPGTGAPAEIKPRWRNILIENLTVSDSQNSIIIWGLPELPITGVTIRKAGFVAQKGALVFNAEKIVFDDVKILCEKPPSLRTHKAGVEVITNCMEMLKL